MALSVTRSFGDLLRDWRQHRRLSQLELALQADISPRHLSFVETSRSKPSREMVLHLAEQLELPLRERNAFLLAAGYAPGSTSRWPNSRSSRSIRPTPQLLEPCRENRKRDRFCHH
jgi:transcriptional regulator with XRE-family HTH domain